MREFTIGKNDAGQRLDRFLGKSLPLLPPALLQKYIRIKRVKCNGQRCQRDQRLREGDVLQLYINDEFFDQPREDNLFLTLFQPRLNILYEDENLLLLDKRPGLVVHADETEKVNTLINHVQAYLYQKREWNPRWENAFTPALCNRIDRNTGGIVMAAKNAETLRILNDKIRDREITKKYLCVVLGRMAPPEGRLRCFLLKDEGKKQVAVYHRPVPGGKSAETPVPHPGDPGGTEPGGGGAPHRPDPPDPGLLRRRGPPPPGGRQVRPGRGEPAVWGRPGRPCTATTSASTSPPAPGSWSTSGAGSFGRSMCPSRRNISRENDEQQGGGPSGLPPSIFNAADGCRPAGAPASPRPGWRR